MFISGIGCAARFPYYMNTYGMHSIHGRRPRWPPAWRWRGPSSTCGSSAATATCCRSAATTSSTRCGATSTSPSLLFNNQIYGLTKGQYSPTSEVGKITKSTPMGSVDEPFNPVSVALGAEATFVARTHDMDRKHMQDVFQRAHAHKGSALVEIFQNCNVFNDGAFARSPRRTSATRCSSS